MRKTADQFAVTFKLPTCLKLESGNPVNRDLTDSYPANHASQRYGAWRRSTRLLRPGRWIFCIFAWRCYYVIIWICLLATLNSWCKDVFVGVYDEDGTLFGMLAIFCIRAHCFSIVLPNWLWNYRSEVDEKQYINNNYYRMITRWINEAWRNKIATNTTVPKTEYSLQHKVSGLGSLEIELHSVARLEALKL